MDWLAFSLSNQQCLLDAFNASPHDHHHHHGVVAGDGMEEDSSGGAHGAVDLTMLTAGSGGPKLEDFLGGCGGEPLGRYSESSPGAALPNGAGDGIYDSDLKTIAAGFLRGYPAEQPELDGGSKAVAAAAEAAAEPKKAVDTFGQRTSIYRGVTRHRWTGRYEAHLWDNSCRREGQSRKGRQVYLGGYDKEEKAARAYDLAALKYWGPTTTTNFPVSNYEKELEEMKNMTRQEFVASLRRKSSGFSRGVSIYRGTTNTVGGRQGIGRVAGNKDLYLGTFSTEEEAAEAYDIAAIKFRGLNAVTNFDMSRYDVKSILASNLPIGGMSGRTSKASDSSSSSSDTRSIDAKQVDGRDLDLCGSSASFAFAMPLKQDQQHQDYWSLLALHQQQAQQAPGSNPPFTLYSPGVNMDFSTATAAVVGQENGNFLLNGGMMLHQQQQHQQQSQGTAGSIPYATPIALGNGYEASGYGGSWVTPVASSVHAYQQAAKTSMGFFPPPIFGIE